MVVCVLVLARCCRLIDWVKEPFCGEKRGSGSSVNSTYSPSESSLSLLAGDWSVFIEDGRSLASCLELFESRQGFRSVLINTSPSLIDDSLSSFREVRGRLMNCGYTRSSQGTLKTSPWAERRQRCSLDAPRCSLSLLTESSQAMLKRDRNAISGTSCCST